jgi:hypothetical protein
VARQLYFWCGGCCRGIVCAHAQLVVMRSGEATGYIVIKHCMLLVTAFSCRGWRHLERLMHTCVVLCVRFELEEHSPCDVSSMLTGICGVVLCPFVAPADQLAAASAAVYGLLNWMLPCTGLLAACSVYDSGNQLTTTCNPGRHSRGKRAVRQHSETGVALVKAMHSSVWAWLLS